MPLTLLSSTGRGDTQLHAECGKCGLHKRCRRPRLPVSGSGEKKLMVVTNYPGLDEEVNGVHLSGKHGRLVTELLRKYGVDLRRDCWTTSAFICRPINPLPPGVIGHCRPNLVNAVKELKPIAILLLGGVACQGLIPHLTDEQVGSEVRWAGYKIPSIKLNAWVCPTFHPSSLDDEKTKVMAGMLERHLEAFCAIKQPPHECVPDYQGRVQLCYGEEEAKLLLHDMCARTSGIAFDFETTTLKPDGPKARIVTCSVSDGRTSIAFPWRGPIVKLMKEILSNPKIKKIGGNIKFEDRWARRKLGVEVKGWFWDTMLGAHLLENNTKEKHITSIKFQALVHLGVESWDSVVGPYLKSQGGNEKLGNAPNRIHQVDMESLLRYNALDSLYEYLVAKIQFKRLKELARR